VEDPELEKLPTDRQEELMRELEKGRGNQRFEEDFGFALSYRWLFRGPDPEHSTSNRRCGGFKQRRCGGFIFESPTPNKASREWNNKA
jgi:hypothetical protein